MMEKPKTGYMKKDSKTDTPIKAMKETITLSSQGSHFLGCR